MRHPSAGPKLHLMLRVRTRVSWHEGVDSVVRKTVSRVRTRATYFQGPHLAEASGAQLPVAAVALLHENRLQRIYLLQRLQRVKGQDQVLRVG